MKQKTFIIVVFISAALAIASGFDAQPKSSIPTPAENAEISQDVPILGAKESANWQKMRAERKDARDKIISKLRERPALEKQGMQKQVSDKRNKRAYKEGNKKTNPPREREPFYERPDSHNHNPLRDMPGPAKKGDRILK